MAELTDASDIREAVREKYAAAARAGAVERARALQSASGCCGSGAVSCSPGDESGAFGAGLYDDAAREDVPEAALSASLGCGVPTAVADLHEGETVLDLGSGAGADVLISARRVGPTGKAIGLDMTDEMLELARANAAAARVENVEFVKGYLEDMPLADGTVDVVISNCVINLSGDKPRVIREAARVLRPGGRLAVSDVVGDPDMDEQTRADMSAWTGCVAGALTATEFRAALHDAGFEDIEIRETHRVHEHAGAAIIRARKPTAMVAGICSLTPVERAAQLDRYRGLGRAAADVERQPGRVVVRFSEDPPAALLERTMEVEQGCCSFFHLAYDPDAQRLTIPRTAPIIAANWMRWLKRSRWGMPSKRGPPPGTSRRRTIPLAQGAAAPRLSRSAATQRTRARAVVRPQLLLRRSAVAGDDRPLSYRCLPRYVEGALTRGDKIFMPRVAPSALGETTSDRVMGQRPELLEAWENLKHALLGPSSTLSPQLKEEVRRTLAQRTGCQFCASLGRPADDHAIRSESLAVAFADAVASDHTAISDAQVKLLFDEFTAPQVVELLVWISFEYAGQMFGCLIGDEPATAEEKEAFAASIAKLPSGAAPLGAGKPNRPAGERGGVS